MAKAEKSKKNTNFEGLKEETLSGILAILCFVSAIYLLMAAFGKGGFAGDKLYEFLELLLGIGYFLLPVLAAVIGTSLLRANHSKFTLSKWLGSALFFLSGLGLIYLLPPHKGGVVGSLIALPLLKLFDLYASLVILLGIITVSLLVILNAELSMEPLEKILQSIKNLFGKKKKEEVLTEEEEALVSSYEEDEEEENDDDEEDEEDEETSSYGIEKKSQKKEVVPPKASRDPYIPQFSSGKPYSPPPLSLLEGDRGKPGVGDIKANANIIKRTLQNFGIEVEMDEISIGPSITRYALKPAEGVKLSRIVALQSNLELALAAHPIRIEAPIPGKSLVGIEIPNSTKTIVGLGSLLASPEFKDSPKPLLTTLGKGISGKSFFSDIAKMPHLLIAGSTGSGKSVTIHALITSLLFRNSPEQLRFIMIDPKRVELTLYNNIPHLLTPVITDAKKTILALKWATKEMDRRYDVLESESVRDIDSYHKNVLAPALLKGVKAEEGAKIPEAMPYIVIVVDELADIMQTYPRELEAGIVRLAQMSRAVGIHLLLSTQRPSVNVITGLIKANVPARIALQVASQIDSRTILDTSGAEKLLGAGDMLFLSGDMSKPQRIQSAYITEEEVKKVVKYLRDTYKDEIPNGIDLTPGSGDNQEKNSIFDSMSDDEEVDDDLYEEAREIVMQSGIAATSYLQRKLRVGYARAARLMDLLEEKGVIGPADGAKRREVHGFKGEAPTQEGDQAEETPHI